MDNKDENYAVTGDWEDGFEAFPDSLSRITRKSEPFYKKSHIEMTLTAGCPMMCSYCPQENYIKGYKDIDTPKKSMTLEDYKVILSNVDVVSYVYFTGFTEPLVNPNWYEIVKYTVDQGFRTSINTTLYSVKSEDIDKLVSLRIPVQIHLTDSKRKIPQDIYEEFLDKYKGIPQVGYFNDTGKSLMPELGRKAAVMHDRGGNLDEDRAPQTKVIKTPVTCSTMRQYSNACLPNGDVSVCCSDFSLEYILGNLLTTKLSEIHNSQKMKDFLAKMAEGDQNFICNKCWYARSTISEKSWKQKKKK